MAISVRPIWLIGSPCPSPGPCAPPGPCPAGGRKYTLRPMTESGSETQTGTKPRVGYIGVGLMGKPMARNLLRKGFPLTVYNRTRAKTDDLAAEGATVAESIAELAAGVDVVCSCVTGPR